ncbi:ATP-binding protein [Actinoplanes bogorensis]|uniref:histidine kinase n=1 Tax=Paractinoplanes bogorensis TaxID=1610840 RepID=A0ABS5YPM5_9ACTN|nr:histidine kinase [Actinoplanes bogorensis]MBU2665333.1 ATP-binding protein [Actinoplanes bogorensis]
MNRGLRNDDVPVAALVLVACLVIQTGRTGATQTGDRWLDWVAVTVPCLALFWRNRWPVPVFAAVLGLVGLGGALGVRTPGIFLVPLVALYAVARHREARTAWVAVAVTVLAGFLTGPVGPAGWTGFAVISVITVAIAVIGINQRTRQAYLTALEDQAHRLEVERDQRARLAVAAEQARIAREMHDVVAHHLTVMVALSEGAAASVPAAPDRASTVMTQVAATGRQALTEMRRIVGLIRRDAPGERTPPPGVDDLDTLIEQVRRAGMRVTVVREGRKGLWGAGAELAIHRIVQEALTNTIKHAGPGVAVEVRLSFGPESAEITVTDDGTATPDEARGEKHGLVGMAERAAAFGSRVEAGPRAGGGWRVHTRLDLGKAA